MTAQNQQGVFDFIFLMPDSNAAARPQALFSFLTRVLQSANQKAVETYMLNVTLQNSQSVILEPF